MFLKTTELPYFIRSPKKQSKMRDRQERRGLFAGSLLAVRDQDARKRNGICFFPVETTDILYFIRSPKNKARCEIDKKGAAFSQGVYCA